MRRDTRTSGQGFYRFLLLVLLSGLLYYMGREGWAFLQVRDNYPLGSSIAGVDVAQLSAEQAAERIRAQYNQPIMAVYETEVVEINPAEAGFVLEMETMLEEAAVQLAASSYGERYLAALIQRPLSPITVPLRANHDPAAVAYLVNLLADMLDKPAKVPQLLSDTGFIQLGEAGRIGDRTAGIESLTAALYQPENRTAVIPVLDQPAPALDMAFLESHLREQMRGFDGTGVIYVLDLQTGEELSINADAAISGLSTVKIAIMLEVLRVVDGELDSDQAKLMAQTAIFSGNYSANLLLDIVAQQDNAYLGVDILTESMHRLGLVNTFIATPYEEAPRPTRPTYTTPANQRTDINLDPDPAMQTTAEEMGLLLAMVYDCAKGGGALLAAYEGKIAPDECQFLLDLLVQNTEGNLIRYGVPETVSVAHKHGWAYNTHGDVGVVFSPGGDYVIVQYLHQDSDWLNANVSFPLLRELSRSVYNYFNVDNPYVDHKRAQKGAGKRAMETILAQIEAGTLSIQPIEETSEPTNEESNDAIP